ncbi:MAG: hypothetical protein HYT48_03475 [Candidatus Vogelbacteria bacterium]|nr:hypothetical protein [Candidatus Vogelbacteria bacterium]
MPKIHRITRIGVWSLAKFQGILTGSLFFAFGLLQLILGAISLPFFPTLLDPQKFQLSLAALIGVGLGFGLMALVVASVLLGLIGFLLGGLTALIYNFIAARIGGVEIQLEAED